MRAGRCMFVCSSLLCVRATQSTACYTHQACHKCCTYTSSAPSSTPFACSGRGIHKARPAESVRHFAVQDREALLERAMPPAAFSRSVGEPDDRRPDEIWLLSCLFYRCVCVLHPHVTVLTISVSSCPTFVPSVIYARVLTHIHAIDYLGLMYKYKYALTRVSVDLGCRFVDCHWVGQVY